MSKVWRRLQRVGKTAYKFDFTIKVHTVTLECVSGWTPNQVSILWVRRGRKVRTEVTSWTTMPGKDTQGVVHWQALEATMTLYMDTNSSKQKFDEKFWTLVVENVGPDGRHKALATKRINMGQFADHTLLPHESKQKYRMKPVASKVHLTELAVTFISKFERQGPAIDDDMISMTSEMSAMTFGGFEDGYMSENEFDNYNNTNKEENEQIMKEIAAIGADFRQLSNFNEDSTGGGGGDAAPYFGQRDGNGSNEHCNKQSNGVTSHQEVLIDWCRKETAGYKDISIEDLTDSWANGAAFCAIIHKYCPDLIKMSQLKDPYSNVKQATKAAVSLGLSPSIDPLDFHKGRLDELSILTFVDQLYQQFKNQKPQAESVLNLSRDSKKTPELIRNNTLPSRKSDLDDSAEEKRRREMIAKGRLRASRRRPNKNKSDTSLDSVPRTLSPRIPARKSSPVRRLPSPAAVTSPSRVTVTSSSPSPVPVSPARSVREDEEMKSELSSPMVAMTGSFDLLSTSSPATANVASSFGDDVIRTSGASLDPDELLREFNRQSPLFLDTPSHLDQQVSQSSSVDDQLVIDALIGKVTPQAHSDAHHGEQSLGTPDELHQLDEITDTPDEAVAPVVEYRLSPHSSVDNVSGRLSQRTHSTSSSEKGPISVPAEVVSVHEAPIDEVLGTVDVEVEVPGKGSPDNVSVESADAILQSLGAEIIRSPSEIRISGIQSAEAEVIDPETLSIKLNESKDELALAKEAVLLNDIVSDVEEQPSGEGIEEKMPDFDEIIRTKFSTDIIPPEEKSEKPPSLAPPAPEESGIEAEIAALEQQLSVTLDPLSPVALQPVKDEIDPLATPLDTTPPITPPPATMTRRGSSLRDKIRGLHNAREKLMTACPGPVVVAASTEKPVKSKPPPVLPKPMLKNRSRESLGHARSNSQESDRSRHSTSSKSSSVRDGGRPPQSTLERQRIVANRLSTEVKVESVSNTEKSVDVAISLTLERGAKPPKGGSEPEPEPTTSAEETEPPESKPEVTPQEAGATLLEAEVTPLEPEMVPTEPEIATSETEIVSQKPEMTPIEPEVVPTEPEITQPVITSEDSGLAPLPQTDVTKEEVSVVEQSDNHLSPKKASTSQRISGSEIQSLSELISSFSPKTEAESSAEEQVSQPRDSSPSTNERAACGSRDSLNRSRDSVNGSRGAMATGSREFGPGVLTASKLTLGSSTSSVSSDPPPPPPPPGPLAMMMGPGEEEGEGDEEEAQGSREGEDSVLDPTILDKQDLQDVRNYISECNTRISEHNTKLDKRAKVLEKELRVAMDAQNHELEQRLLKSWLHLVHERNTLVRKQDELNSLQNEEHLEERCEQVLKEMRKYQNIRDNEKTEQDVDREEQLEEEYKEILRKRGVLLRIRDDISMISKEEEAEFRSVIEKPKLLQDQSSCKVS